MRDEILAYIDPISGTVLVQAIIAGIVGTALFFHRHVLALWRKLTRTKPPSEGPHGDAP